MSNTGEYKLRYIVGFWLIEMAISTTGTYFFLEWDAIHHSSISGACDLDQSEAYTIYRNLYKNAAP